MVYTLITTSENLPRKQETGRPAQEIKAGANRGKPRGAKLKDLSLTRSKGGESPLDKVAWRTDNLTLKPE